MAKLSAHGIEAFRLTQIRPRSPNDVQPKTKNDHTVVSIRSDLSVLRKAMIVRNAYSWETPGEKYNDTGWKLRFTRKQMIAKGYSTPEQIRDAYVKIGFTVEV